MQQRKRLYIDYSKCIGCETCEQVCKFIRNKPRIHMTRTTDGVSVPLYCQHCEKPQCIKACPKDALYRDEQGAVILRSLKCVYCETKDCITACPYGAIYCSGREAPVLKCDMCARRRKVGMGPACVETCPSRAIFYVDRAEVKTLQTKASVSAFKRVMAHLRPPVWSKGVPAKRAVDVAVDDYVPPSMLRLADLELAGQQVLVREDLNVPVKNGRVTNDKRIQAALPTIRHCLSAGAGVMVMSHLGRPKEGQYDEEFSLKPVAEHLGRLLDRPVVLVKDWLEGMSINPGQVVLLENVRFLEGENGNSDELGRRMANLCDIFVMDAFGASHRAQASTNAVARFAPTSCAGLLLSRELDALSKGLKSPARPMTAIVGGSKVSTKLTVLESLCTRVDHLIVGGGIANTFIAAAGYNVGKSLYEPGLVSRAEDIRNAAQDAGAIIPIPKDVVCAKEFSESAQGMVKQLGQIEDDDLILDVGPQTAKEYASIMKRSGTIVWNGPVGVFEFDQFAGGTRALTHAIADSDAFSIAGGGDTLAAIDAFGVAESISYISTGGGAFLKFLEGKQLPAVSVLEERAGFCLLPSCPPARVQ